MVRRQRLLLRVPHRRHDRPWRSLDPRGGVHEEALIRELLADLAAHA